ncbi:hypothetical protein NDU88_004341 [Pleurodeles waltl]|uniref:Uncharacterized protein n=1 Tax=Pleurodeles waltl TaxID=8319 RepID=A0AAV7MTB3_PLEWA|nr:hypothetical protein NDU88_004341 [Pleurodeles waltl]
MSVFQNNYGQYVSAPRRSPWRLDFVCLVTWSAASVLHFSLHCFSTLVRRCVLRMPARGSKAAPAGAGAGAGMRQERTRDSGSVGEGKKVRTSTRMSGEPDKLKAASSVKTASAPLGKYFKAKLHTNLVVKTKETTGNSMNRGRIVDPVELNANIPPGVCVAEQENLNCAVPPILVRIDVPTKKVAEVTNEKGRNLELLNDSAPGNTVAQAPPQDLTQPPVHDLTLVRTGEKAEKGKQTGGKRGLVFKMGQDLDLGDRYFSLSEQSSWTSDEASEVKVGGSRFRKRPGLKQVLSQPYRERRNV